MHPHEGCARSRLVSRARFDFGEIVRAHSEAYRARYPLSGEQAQVLRAVAACRSSALGGHLDVCLDCGYERPAYNSCRNRHCPKCQALEQHRWLEQRQRRILPTHYFHVVFTLPRELTALAPRNRSRLYELLMRSAAETLLQLGTDPKRLGAQLGITTVLHTWTRDLRLHPHVHAIVTGGGLSLDEQRWIDAGTRYLFPVKVLSRLFRGKLLDQLDPSQLELPPELQSQRAFAHFKSALYAKDWVVYAKRPFAGAQQVFAYLARYTHRVALSNHRLLEVTENAVTLATRDGNSVTLSPLELIRRFLLHVLPRRFVKIRHYGLMAASNVHTRLEIARELLLTRADAPGTNRTAEYHDEIDTAVLCLLRLTGIDLRLCPACGGLRLVRRPLQRARPPPERTSA